MDKKKISRILSGNYKDVGFERGFGQAMSGEPISHIHRTDINPVNWVFRHKDADETYDAGVHAGYDAGLKKKHGVYESNPASGATQGARTTTGGAGVQTFSLYQQMEMVNAMVDNLQALKGFFGTIRDGYGQNINRSEQMGLGEQYMAGLRERETRLNTTMDQLEALIEKHVRELDDAHRAQIQFLIDSLDD